MGIEIDREVHLRMLLQPRAEIVESFLDNQAGQSGYQAGLLRQRHKDFRRQERAVRLRPAGEGFGAGDFPDCNETIGW